eukprot:5940641-Amphidinium_carterae.1
MPGGFGTPRGVVSWEDVDYFVVTESHRQVMDDVAKRRTPTEIAGAMVGKNRNFIFWPRRYARADIKWHPMDSRIGVPSDLQHLHKGGCGLWHDFEGPSSARYVSECETGVELLLIFLVCEFYMSICWMHCHVSYTSLCLLCLVQCRVFLQTFAAGLTRPMLSFGQKAPNLGNGQGRSGRNNKNRTVLILARTVNEGLGVHSEQ